YTTGYRRLLPSYDGGRYTVTLRALPSCGLATPASVWIARARTGRRGNSFRRSFCQRLTRTILPDDRLFAPERDRRIDARGAARRRVRGRCRDRRERGRDDRK